MMKKLILSVFSLSGLFGLGFGSMGNTSAGLGDSGVALRKSAWGIYYNPALLASDNRGKFGYSFGVSARQKGLDALIGSIGHPDANPQSVQDALNAQSIKQISVDSQNGIVIQITGGTHEEKDIVDGQALVVEKRNPYGAFTLASFASVYAVGDVKIASTNGSQDSEGSAGQNSIDASIVGLLEVPVGWGWRFETPAGDVSVGASVKYMAATGARMAIDLENQAISPNLEQLRNLPIAHNFGIDLGLLYSPFESLHLGFVAKNVNAPNFEVLGRNLQVLPQLRFGLSYEFAKYFTLTFDSDLAPNRLLFADSPKTQMLGGGLLMDFTYIDLRLGVMGDMANKFEQGVIMTGGINLLGFLDLAVQASSAMVDARGYKVPKFVTAKLGGSFTF